MRTSGAGRADARRSIQTLDEMKNHADSINQFNSLLVDYLNTFNILETNIGLCISRLENNGIDAAYNKLKNLSCEKRLIISIK